MISIGGAVGAGLFVGSGAGIATAGPAILVSYGVTALLVVVIMRMLAEMSVARPDTGAFAHHARTAFGRWAGSTTGWMYWFGWPLGMAVESIAVGKILHGWIPTVPAWLAALGLLLLVTAINFISVRIYGEVEFWAVLLKVIVILGFISVGLLAIFGVLPGVGAPGTSNILGAGGFFPMGISGVISATAIAVFSFSGTEIVTIAAGEAADPAAAIAKSTRTVVYRVSIFYLGSLAVIVMLLPWNSGEVGESPFVATLEHLGLKNGAAVISAVVFVSLMSTMNSQVYASSRMMYTLARDEDAPSFLGRLSSAGTPRNAIIITVGLAMGGAVLQFFYPTEAFIRLVNVGGCTVYLTWLTIAVTQIFLGRRDRREGRPPAAGTAMWFFPYASWVIVAAMVALMFVLLALPATRADMAGALILTALVVTASVWWQREHPKRAARRAVTQDVTATSTSGTPVR
ncbi:amino acid permease [Rhodococcus sp. IEGM 1381]|uniref:amino acid permease n=1 Tax=Rhodococcus sp. IEGM 1381 TaxID=3047085 RepID=UPI0024B6B15A|nr:amino acid permease [Rhodococcus sp. IEGM 1381]